MYKYGQGYFRAGKIKANKCRNQSIINRFYGTQSRHNQTTQQGMVYTKISQIKQGKPRSENKTPLTREEALEDCDP